MKPETKPTNLKSLLRKHGLSARDLARLIGVADSVMSRYVHGLERPNDERASAMAAALECEVAEMGLREAVPRGPRRARGRLNTALIERQMRKLKISPAELARRVDVPRESVSKWLEGGRMPTPPALRRLAREVEKTVEELVVEGEERNLFKEIMAGFKELKDDREGKIKLRRTKITREG